MNIKIKTLLLLIASLFVYLSWGPCNEAFLVQIEIDVLKKLLSDPVAALHPFTIIPLLGQLVLVITLVQKTPSNLLLKTGISCLLFLIGFVFIVGLLSLRLPIIISTLPFIILAFITLKSLRTIK